MSKNKLVGSDGTELSVSERDPQSLKFEPHPNIVFATKVDKEKTKGGIYLPETSGKSPTPIGKVMAIGNNIKERFDKANFNLEVGDFIYIDANFMRFGEIDGIKGIIIVADAILGKVKQD